MIGITGGSQQETAPTASKTDPAMARREPKTTKAIATTLPQINSEDVGYSKFSFLQETDTGAQPSPKQPLMLSII